MARGSLHYVEECVHGKIVRQCRCPSKDKPVKTVPCPKSCPDSNMGVGMVDEYVDKELL